MLKVNTQRNGHSAVDSLLSDVMRFSVQYGNLTPNERKDFDAKLESLAKANNPKCDSKKMVWNECMMHYVENKQTNQQANLGGDAFENTDENEEPEYIKQLKEPRAEPKKVWRNDRAE